MWIFTSASHISERLRVGVHGDELDAREARVDHAVDRVRTAAADADDLDHSEVVTGTISSQVRLDLKTQLQAGARLHLLHAQRTAHRSVCQRGKRNLRAIDMQLYLRL